jgi:hypothetical protein
MTAQLHAHVMPESPKLGGQVIKAPVGAGDQVALLGAALGEKNNTQRTLSPFLERTTSVFRLIMQKTDRD